MGACVTELHAEKGVDLVTPLPTGKGRMTRICLAGSLIAIFCAAPVLGAPRAAAAKARTVPAVSGLELSPPELKLSGAGTTEAVYVTAVLPNGAREDVTEKASFVTRAPGIRVLKGGLVQAVRDGSATVNVTYRGRTVRLPVTVVQAASPRPVSYQYDVLPILSKAGCNQGACHGNAEGKGGFKISLKGEDPAGDYEVIVRHGGGRRINTANPGASLLLLKATSAVPHGGGLRFKADSPQYRTLATWVAEGARLDPPGAPTLTRLEVTPREQIVSEPAQHVRLTVRGHFSDGSVRSLADRVVYNPGDPRVEVSPDGLVTLHGPADLAVLVRYADQMENVRLTCIPEAKRFAWKPVPANNWIDDLNFRRLKTLRLQPSDLSGDTEFLRRAYLDTLGLLPTPDEVRAFAADTRPDKRARLIDALIDRPEFADLWTMRWASVLRIEERTLDPKGAQIYRDWLRTCITTGKPFDEVVRELITGTGSTYTNPPANYYRRTRAADELAETTAQVFMGTRMLCARCHNHPFERWKQDDYYTLAAFFSRVDRKTEQLTRKDRFDVHEHNGEEIISVSQTPPTKLAEDAAAVAKIDKGSELVKGGEVAHPRTGGIVHYGLPSRLRYPELAGMTPQEANAAPDRRVVFARWLTNPENPFFAKAVVNRIWYHLMGKGIVDPVDDIRESNPPSNPELLDALAKDFVQNRYDLRRTVRTIMNSRTYQLSSEANTTNAQDERFFSRAIPQRLPAEVLLDVISQLTGSPASLPANATGGRAVNLIPVNKQRQPFLKVFGQPARESSCDCERSNETTLGQSFELISGTAINTMLKRPENRVGRLMQAGKSDSEIITELYLASVSREPSGAEVEKLKSYIASKPDRRSALEDVTWALVNSKEFILRR